MNAKVGSRRATSRLSNPRRTSGVDPYGVDVVAGDPVEHLVEEGIGLVVAETEEDVSEALVLIAAGEAEVHLAELFALGELGVGWATARGPPCTRRGPGPTGGGLPGPCPGRGSPWGRRRQPVPRAGGSRWRWSRGRSSRRPGATRRSIGRARASPGGRRPGDSSRSVLPLEGASRIGRWRVGCRGGRPGLLGRERPLGLVTSRPAPGVDRVPLPSCGFQVARSIEWVRNVRSVMDPMRARPIGSIRQGFGLRPAPLDTTISQDGKALI